MSLAGVADETARFRLSPEGIAVVAEVFGEPEFEAKIAGTDELGVWVDLGDGVATLLKWQYLATMAVALRAPESSEPKEKRIGF